MHSATRYSPASLVYPKKSLFGPSLGLVGQGLQKSVVVSNSDNSALLSVNICGKLKSVKQVIATGSNKL
ncbi:hypothetical protein cyc_03133 [Cyclospora cayetanensis]|uniref:Uncharacterized protein n=1 Tax=Cyclospora cayetanensis TaxID=88456 RepID=A0A1D3CYX4_9EIME|nr:hypothetical protein cyc_03133 [Cyclospora cayetanensis]